VNVVGLKNSAKVRLVGGGGAQPLDRRLLVAESFEEGKMESSWGQTADLPIAKWLLLFQRRSTVRPSRRNHITHAAPFLRPGHAAGLGVFGQEPRISKLSIYCNSDARNSALGYQNPGRCLHILMLIGGAAQRTQPSR